VLNQERVAQLQPDGKASGSICEEGRLEATAEGLSILGQHAKETRGLLGHGAVRLEDERNKDAAVAFREGAVFDALLLGSKLSSREVERGCRVNAPFTRVRDTDINEEGAA